MAGTDNNSLDGRVGRDYAAGFVTDIEADTLPPGLDEDVVRFISARKDEPEWLTQWRLDAYHGWLEMIEPSWGQVQFPAIDYQSISYYSAPSGDQPKTLDDVDPEILATYEKLGIPLHEQAALAGVAEAQQRPPVAVDAVFDSVSIGTTFKETLPENTRCPMELSTYFRINERNTGQFERTLIIAERGAYVSYLEGCTAPMRDENQLHAAVVELIALDDAEIKYSTVQNWYPGDEDGRGGIYNFVTKRGACRGDRSKISWTQVETGSAITWKYPSVVLRGDDSVGEFYSVALTNNHQQADTGTKMVHLGKNTRSTIISKGISAGQSSNAYRGLVRMNPGAEKARNYTQCDSLLIGEKCAAHTFPYIESRRPDGIVEHEATTSRVSDDQLFLCRQRGIDPEKAVSMIVNGFCKDVFRELPMEFAVEAGKLLEVSLEGAVG